MRNCNKYLLNLDVFSRLCQYLIKFVKKTSAAPIHVVTTAPKKNASNTVLLASK